MSNGASFVVLTPHKPLWGEPCNGCGVCCQRSACEIAQKVAGDSEFGPCSLLEWDGSRYRCGALRMALAMGEVAVSIIRSKLGIGYGCDSEVCAEDTAAKLATEAA